MRFSREIHVGARRVRLQQGSILDVDTGEIDALVSADDNYLSHGGGVSAALWRAAGPELELHTEHLPGLRLGDVYDTPGYDLKAGWLLHAITVDFDSNRRLGPLEARQLFGAVLDRAAELGCETVALPLLGAGAGRLNVAASALAAAEAIDERAAVQTSLHTVVVVALDREYGELEQVFSERIVPRPALGELLGAAAASAGPPALVLLETWRAGGTSEASLPRLLDLAMTALLARGLTLARASDPDVEGAKSLGLGALLDAAEASFRTAGVPLPARLRFTCTAAAEARNRLVHAPPETSSGRSELQRTMLHAVEQIVLFLGETKAPADARSVAVPIGASIAAALGLPRPAVTASAALDRLRAWQTGSPAKPKEERTQGGASLARSASEEGGPALAGPVSSHAPRPAAAALRARVANAEPAPPASARAEARPVHRMPPDTAHVRRLRDFLLQRLSPAALEALLAELVQDRYRGRDEERLLEHCVRADPIDLLTQEFNGRALATELERETGISARRGASSEELAAQLLEAFGFPALQTPRGLESARRQILRLQGELTTGSSVQLRGAVTEASAHLEYLVQVLLRFVCQAAFRQSPEAFFQARGKLERSYTIDRCSLGTLLDLLQHLAGALERSEGTAAELRRDLGARRLVPPGTTQLAESRNRFAHAEREGEELPLADARRLAQTFFDEALRFVGYLGGDEENRVFPHVIRIERIAVDRWGRRVVEAVSDGDVHERVFTDVQLQPGQLYFMHPLTNPLRVDPILVPAGEIERQPGR